MLLVSRSLRRGSYNTAQLREAPNALPRGVGHVWLDGIAGCRRPTVRMTTVSGRPRQRVQPFVVGRVDGPLADFAGRIAGGQVAEFRQ